MAGRIIFSRSRGMLCCKSPASSIIGRSRSLSTLAILEAQHGRLNHGSLSALAAAQKLGGTVHGFIAGGDASAVAKEACKVQGIETILCVENSAYDKGLPENYSQLLAENIRNGKYSHVVAVHSAFGKNVLPRVAALLDSQQISDIISIKDDHTFVRPIYAGNIIVTVESSDPVKLLTVRRTAFAPATIGSGSAAILEGVDPKAASISEWVSEDLTTSDRPDLATAGRVVSGGRGLKSKQDFDNIMMPLANALGAAVGASRAAVDSGYADNSLQVGQTGKVVAPELYMAIGISGAIQHLAGMKDSKVIAAINKDADAPIFQVADIGLVGDLFDKVPEFTGKITTSKS